MKKIQIHVGMNKTGSTSMQRYFLENQKELLEQGVLYPSVGLVGVGHHSIPWSMGLGSALRDNEAFVSDNIIIPLIEEFEGSGADTMLISSEYFCLATLSHVGEIAKVFSSFGDIEIYFVIRRQDKWVESLYSEAVKGLLAKVDIATYYYKRVSQALDFYSMMLLWDEYFKGNVKVIPYVEKSCNIHHEITKTLGINLEIFRDVKSENISLSPQALAVMRMLPRKEKFTQSEHEKIIELLRDVPFKNKNMPLLPPVLRNEILEKYRQSNINLENDYLSGERIFSNCYANSDEWERPDVLDEGDIMKLIGVLDEKIGMPDIIQSMIRRILSQ